MLELLCFGVLELLCRGVCSRRCVVVYARENTVIRLTMATMVTKGDRQLRFKVYSGH
jgi:hypothetical protein